MSYQHQNRFDEINREHAEVKKLLVLASKPRKAKTGPKSKSPALDRVDQGIIKAAILTADNAYALLLIATAEGFMRDYLTSIGILPGDEPKLSALIDRSYKEFNKRNPKTKIHRDTKSKLHNLRAQRNSYAHANGSVAFPTVGQIVSTLGQFFKDIP